MEDEESIFNKILMGASFTIILIVGFILLSLLFSSVNNNSKSEFDWRDQDPIYQGADGVRSGW